MPPSASRPEPGNGDPRWRIKDDGDLIRGAVPIVAPGSGGRVVGAIVVSYFPPYPLTQNVASIRETLKEYRILQPKAVEIRTVYLLQLLLEPVEEAGVSVAFLKENRMVPVADSADGLVIVIQYANEVAAEVLQIAGASIDWRLFSTAGRRKIQVAEIRSVARTC